MALLAWSLCRQGATCYLFPHSQWQQEVGALAPDFVLLSNFRRTRRNIVKTIVNAGIDVGILDSEGGVLSSFDWYRDALEPDPQVRYSISSFFSWGTRLAEHALAKEWFHPEQVVVTGHPRFDFYAPPWLKVHLPNSPDASQYRKPVVLISGRYSLTNPHDSTAEQKIQRIAQIRNYSIEHVRSLEKSQREGMVGMVELVNRLAKGFPELTFIYRPHPFERLSTYHDLLELDSCDNLHLTKQGAIQDWLKLTDCVIQRGCTTAIEAGMLGIPSLSPRWIATPEEIETVESVSIPCASAEDVEARIASLRQGELKRPLEIVQAHQRVIEDWFYKIDGHCHERVADAIKARVDHNPRTPDKQRCQEIFDSSKENQRRKSRLTGRIKSLLRTTASSCEPEQEQSEEPLDEQHVRNIIASIMGSLNTIDTGRTAVTVAPAQVGTDYQLKIQQGCSVVVRPSPAISTVGAQQSR